MNSGREWRKVYFGCKGQKYKWYLLSKVDARILGFEEHKECYKEDSNFASFKSKQKITSSKMVIFSKVINCVYLRWCLRIIDERSSQ